MPIDNPAPSNAGQAIQAPSLLKKPSSKGLVVLVIAIFALTSAGVFLLQQNEKKNAASSVQQQEQEALSKPVISSPIAPYSLIYGYWDGKTSSIKSVNLSTGKTKIIANLASNAKKVNQLSSNELLYIDDTDDQDHGERLSIALLADRKIKPSVRADRGFGIDDYVLSKNKQYVATWEVSFRPGSTVLTGGRSRVYVVSIANPGDKHLLYDEEVMGPVHYPLAVLDDGKVLLDKFQANDPNGGTGWAYGMSVASFDGKQKQDLKQMANGPYGTQPVLSPDGKNLAFAGYDGSLGSGAKVVDGYRQAILTPNTIELLNTSTLKRQKLPNLPNSSSYVSVAWNAPDGNILFTAIGSDPSGNFTYDLSTKTTKSNDYVSDANGSTPTFIADLQSGKILLGTADNSPTSLGNLGDSYAAPYTRFYVQDGKSSIKIELDLHDPFMQYIMVVPNDKLVLGATTQTASTQVASMVDPYPNNKNDMVQLKTFFLKADLPAKREESQAGGVECPQPGGGSGTVPSGTKKSSVNVAVPSASTGPSGGPQGPDCKPSSDKNEQCKVLGKKQCLAKGLKDQSPEYMKCVQDVIAKNYKKGDVCYDSPLYLYGEAGQNVQVQVNTPLYSSGPSYNKGYDVTLSENGGMLIAGKLYSSIEYDYNPGTLKITPPTRGAFVSRDDVAKTLTEYASRLGLNGKERSDLLAFGRERVTSPYAYISFFNQETSERILPLSFSITPDNYLNVVFYFKLLSSQANFTVLPPVFGPPLRRTGFTAVEVSELVE